MSESLSDRLGIGGAELVSIVGAGGKSTILFTVGRERAAASHRVLLTTTTKMAADQVTDPVCWSSDPAAVIAALTSGDPLFVAAGRVPGKVTGPSPESVDCLFAQPAVDDVIVEADGARSMSIKAPADHEPVIPSASTTVVVVCGIDAVGRRVDQVAHRPDRVAALAGVDVGAHLAVEHVARVLLDPSGGLKGIPDTARAVSVITKVTAATERPARALSAIVGAHPRIDRVVLLPAT